MKDTQILTDQTVPIDSTRRRLLSHSGLGIAVLSMGLHSSTQLLAAEAGEGRTMAANSPPEHAPSSEPVFNITATIDGAMTVGETATGTIRAIPITGGTVEGDGISGRVIPGGADWQLTRRDGVTEIEATYAIELGGDTLIKVVNQGIIVPPAAQGEDAYFRTHVQFDAPAGEYEWMNEAIFLCRAGLHPSQQVAVLVEVFRLI